MIVKTIFYLFREIIGFPLNPSQRCAELSSSNLHKVVNFAEQKLEQMRKAPLRNVYLNNHT